jgi:RNAse (barnase) inhibitor barstar
MKPVIRIDGLQFSTLEGFFEHFTAQALGRSVWGRNLDAFNDVLRGGFGTPEGGFVLEWMHHEVSEERLGYPETIRQLEMRAARCDPTNVPHVHEQLAAARRAQGSTVYEWLIAIIQSHCPGGDEEGDRIELRLR